jgi:RNA polymerase I-specific transcription initiation factor RRN7
MQPYVVYGEHFFHADHQVLREHFPMQDSPQAPVDARATELPGWNLAGSSISEEVNGELGPGKNYAIFNSRDILGVLPGDLELILERGVKWLGVEMPYMCGVVEKYEHRLRAWWQRESRRRRKQETGLRGGCWDDEMSAEDG